MKRLRTEIRPFWPQTGTLLAALAGAITLSGDLPAHGQEAKAESAPKADFGPAFERLIALGLPDATDAEPVATDYSEGDTALAWLLESRGNEATILLDQVTPTVCRKEPSDDEDDAPHGVATGVSWRPAKIEVFLKHITTVLERQKAELLKGEYFYNDVGEYYGNYLLFAAHLYRRGQRDEANALATLLFESSKVPETAATLALDLLAESRYEAFATTFFGDGDWLAFADGIDAIIADFGARWKTAPGALLLAEKLRARAGAPTPPVIDASGLDAVDHSLLASLSSVKPGSRMPSVFRRDEEGGYRLWILDPPTLEAGETSAFTRILARGVDSVPLLLALLGDDYLLPIAASGSDGYGDLRHRRRFDYGDSDEEILPDAEMLYAQLTRPISRGEIALALLSPLLGPEAEGVITPAELTPLARNWVEAHGKQSPLDLARYYLASGREAQVQAAVGVLIDKGEDADLTEIEKYLLAFNPEDGYVFEKFNAVTAYLRKRGAEGKDFLARYEDMTRKAYQEEQGGGFLQKMSTNSELKRYFAPLHELVNPRTFEVMLEEMLAGDTPVTEMSPLISSKLQEIKDAKEKQAAMGSLLRKAIAHSDRPETAFGLLGIVGSSFRDYNSPPLALSHQEEWQALLGSETAKPNAFGAQSLSMAEYGAYLMETTYGEVEDVRRLGGLYRLDWQRANALGIARATARLEGKTGKDLTGLPDLGDGADKEKAAVAWKNLAGIEPSSLREKLQDIELASLAAFQAHLVEFRRARDSDSLDEAVDPPDPDVLAGMAREANRVVSITLPDDLEDAFPMLRDAQDKALDKARLEALVEALKPLASSGSGDIVTITIQRGDVLSGTTVTAARTPASGLPSEERSYLTRSQGSLDRGSPHALVVGYYGSYTARGQALWDCGATATPTETAKTVSETEASGGDAGDEDALEPAEDSERDSSSAASRIEDFWNEVDALLNGTENPLGYAALVVWAVPAQAFAPETKPSEEKNPSSGPSP